MSIDLKNRWKYLRSKPKIFQTYISAAKKLEELHKKYLPIIESFALIVCEEYFKRKMGIQTSINPIIIVLEIGAN